MNKSDRQIYSITISAIKRKARDMENWKHSFISDAKDQELVSKFDLVDKELPVFEVKSRQAHTLITTRRIQERTDLELKIIQFEDIKNIEFGNFKGETNKTSISEFNVTTHDKVKHNFQYETGYTSMGMIYSIRTILQLKSTIIPD